MKATATANLENDHVHILRLTDVMERITQSPQVNTEHLETVVELIKHYADGLHHTKEETLLFPLMVEKGFSLQQGPVSVMLRDHVQGREYVKGMVESIALYQQGDSSALVSIYQNMTGYVELLRAHIAKENNVLFRMADNVLSEAEQASLLTQFEKVETSNVCGGVLNDCIRKIESLASTYHI
jgi:hemerythrin-like domain-containing protein